MPSAGIDSVDFVVGFQRNVGKARTIRVIRVNLRPFPLLHIAGAQRRAVLRRQERLRRIWTIMRTELMK